MSIFADFMNGKLGIENLMNIKKESVQQLGNYGRFLSIKLNVKHIHLCFGRGLALWGMGYM
jgi:hypothetical protein